jgi:branched-chain amino acid transport system substrate-binding protein
MLGHKAYKVAVLLLAFIFVAGLLAGCGSSSGDGGQGAAEEEQTVKIAFLGPLTGPNAGQGVGARNAFLLAVDQANESGDLPFKLEVIELDDESKPATSASVAQKAVADPEVVAGSGHWNTSCAEASVPIFKSAGIPFIIWGAIGPDLTSPENYPNTTRVAPTQAQENIPLAEFVIGELGRKKWAMISDTSSLYYL